jgi:hypothetical protein
MPESKHPCSDGTVELLEGILTAPDDAKNGGSEWVSNLRCLSRLPKSGAWREEALGGSEWEPKVPINSN